MIKTTREIFRAEARVKGAAAAVMNALAIEQSAGIIAVKAARLTGSSVMMIPTARDAAALAEVVVADATTDATITGAGVTASAQIAGMMSNATEVRLTQERDGVAARMTGVIMIVRGWRTGVIMSGAGLRSEVVGLHALMCVAATS
jgi:hypothetical protein